jgi:16S rRNA processing protein RimM
MAGGAGETGEYLIVARVRRPHGVRGELLIAVDTDRPKQVFRSGRPLVVADGRGEAPGETVTVGGLRATTGGGLLRLVEVDSREGAEALRGRTLLIPAEEAAPAARDEVHYRDLVGMEVRDVDGAVGTVDDILELASGEVLVVRRPGGKELLIPFARDLVREVDVEARVLRVELPEGYLEL